MTPDPTWVELLWGSIWSGNSLVGRVIVLSIVFLAWLAIRAARRHLRRYQQEGAMLERVAAQLRKWRQEDGEPGEVTAPDSAHDAQGHGAQGHDAQGEDVASSAAEEPLAEGSSERPTPQDLVEPLAGPALIQVARLQEGIDRKTLIWHRLNAIETLREHRVRVNVGTLQQLSAARDEAQPGLATASYVAGVSMMLGIFGTFVGLAVMVQQIHLGLPAGGGALTMESWTDSIQNLRGVLGGMKTAFSTSLLGMASAIVCSWMDFRLRRSQAVFFEKLERFTAEELLPASVPAVEDETLLEEVSEQVRGSFDRLEHIQRQNQKVLKDLSGAQEAFSVIIQDIRTITQSNAAKHLDRVVVQLGETNRAVLGVVEHLPRLVAATERMGRETLARMDTALSSRNVLAPPGGWSSPWSHRLIMALVLIFLIWGAFQLF